MLEFNQEHKAADLSAIESKTKKVKYAGKVMLCGITLSAVLILSGCSNSNTNTDVQSNPVEPTITSSDAVEPTITSTAIIMENGNAMIVDLQSYQKYIDERDSMDLVSLATVADDRTWILYTSTGDKILVDFDSVKFIEGEDSHEKAETIAQSLISESGQITCYDEVQSYGKTK